MKIAITTAIVLLVSFDLYSQIVERGFDERELTPSQKDELINSLDSLDVGVRVNAIRLLTRHRVVEALPRIEQLFWKQEPFLRFLFADAMAELGSSNTANMTHALIDSADRIPPGVFFDDPLENKVHATKVLFKIGDYSTAHYVFEILQRDSPKVNVVARSLLKDIVIKVDSLSGKAKNTLLQIAKNGYDQDSQILSLAELVELYGVEARDVAVHVAQSSGYPVNRFLALGIVLTFGYEHARDLLYNRLGEEAERAYRVSIADTILTKLGDPRDFAYVLQALQAEPHPTSKYLIKESLRLFVPPSPSSSLSLIALLDSLVSTIQQVRSLNWVSDFAFALELETSIQNASTSIAAGDSIDGAVLVKRFQLIVDEEYRDSLDNDNRRVTLEGWKFLYYHAQYILDRLPAVSLVSPYSVLATHSLWLEQNSTVYSGDMGVNDAGSPPFLNSDVELTIGIGTTVSPSSVKAHRIKVKDGAVISADVYYNELENNGTITGNLHTPLILPLVSALPVFKTAIPGTTNITIPQDGNQTLTPGSYGELLVRKNGTLILTGGEYHFDSFNTGDNARIVFQTASEVRIAQKFDSDQGSYIGPEDTTSLSADKIVFYVAGTNGSSGTLSATPKATQIGIANTVKANFYVPNGTLWIRQNSQVTGAFIGKDVDAGIGVKVWHKSAF